MSYKICACPLCDGQDFVTVLTARDFHYGNSGEYVLAQCTQCSLCFQSPMHNEAELSGFYPQNYYSFTDRFSPNDYPSVFKRVGGYFFGFREHQTRDPKFEHPGRMLDVGCGSGWFLTKMRSLGWEVTGVEPSLAAAQLGRLEQGLNIFAGALPDAALQRESFDYIRFNHSFEHVSNPNEILAETHRILANKGKLMIGVPNRASLNAKLFGPYWYHLALPLHTFCYSTRTLSMMLEKHSFKIEKVVYNTELTALLGSLQLFLNRNDWPLSSEGRVFRSRSAQVLCAWAASLQNLLHIADCIEITAVKK
jgi:2-polyprenyl-3-methyl-5-hydroxy-6-metoxy-1,4-benzoquinol methylase